MTRVTCALLALLVTACDPTSGGSSSTSTSSTSDSESSSGTTTSEPSTGDESTSTGADTGSTDPTEGGKAWEGGRCVGFAPTSCYVSGSGWCDDLVGLCSMSGADAAFCGDLKSACRVGEQTPCSLCKDLWTDCGRRLGVTSEECQDLGETCGCLVDGNGVQPV